MGRRKIEIQPLTDDRNRTVTFVKRKAGLFKKAYELAVLCQVDLAVIIVGNNDKVYEFLSVDTKELLKTYSRVKPHELKLPEYYGHYKKKSHMTNSGVVIKEELHDVPIDDANADSDYDLDTPEPKRKKTGASPALIYQKKPVPSRFALLGQQDDLQTQRPVLRVQIPSDIKAQDDLAKTITALDTIDTRKDKLAENDVQAPNLATGNATRYLFGKFKSPETKKVPQLPLPISQLQTLSPILTTAPQLPGGMPFFSLLPQPLPQGQYPPAILPTPVFNQVFNQWQGANLATGTSSGTALNLGATNSGSSAGNPTASTATNAGSTLSAAANAPGAGNAGLDEDAPKFRPPLQQNGEQTPMLALPSRYMMNDIFPLPSTLYPAQEWPTGMTPYTLSMPHYFMVPSANGATPLPMNSVYANARQSLLGQPQRQFQPGPGQGLQQGGPEYNQYYKRG